MCRWLLNVGLVLTLVLSVTGCQQDDESPSRPPRAVRGLEFATVREAPLAVYSEVSATVRAAELSLVASRTMGVVQAVHVRAGQPVKAGQVLVTIEARDAAARAVAAASAVKAARERLDLVELTWRRYQALYARSAISRQQYDELSASRRQAAAEYARTVAQAEEAAVVKNFERITAPFDGVVTRRLVDPGSLAAPSQVLLELEAAGARHLEAAVNESFSARLRVGQSIAVELAGRRTAGRIYEINPAIDPASRSFMIKVRLEQDAGLASGAFARIFLEQSSRPGLVVPETALIRRGQLVGVYIVDRAGRLRYRLVRPGEPTAEGREILAGLRAGETVVSAGLARVVEGAAVAGRP